MLGSISKINDTVTITINKHMMFERRNFTTMHEIIHYYKDIPYVTESRTFTDMISKNGYFNEDLPREYRANVGASILMANDKALKFALHKFKSFGEVANYFFISNAALHLRLRNSLVYEKALTVEHAQYLTNIYRYSGNRLIVEYFLD
jgi:Zn-dependent peptidase ImmA (M78 family)